MENKNTQLQKREFFNFYRQGYEILKRLEDSKKIDLFMAIMEVNFGYKDLDEIVFDDNELSLSWDSLKPNIALSLVRTLAGMKGGKISKRKYPKSNEEKVENSDEEKIEKIDEKVKSEEKPKKKKCRHTLFNLLNKVNVNNNLNNNLNNNITNNNITSKNNKKSKKSKLKLKKIFYEQKNIKQLVNLFYEKQGNFYFDAKRFNEIKEEWASVIEKMIRIDKLTEEQIEFIINWLFADNPTTSATFWKKNIRTPKKLRIKNSEGIFYWQVLIDEIKAEVLKKKKKENTSPSMILKF